MDLLAERMRRFSGAVTVYAVSGEEFAGGRTDLDWLAGVLDGGAGIVQLRDKRSPDRVLLEKARAFRRQTAARGALFIVNDRVDIALMAAADGVHVGADDLEAGDIRRLAPGLLIGVSCNSAAQAAALGAACAEGRSAASYFNIGPIFATSTKKEKREVLGPEAIQTFSRLCPLPFTVMGGIKRPHLPLLVAAGARRIAVVTALTTADDIAAETRLWMEELGAACLGGGQHG